MKNPLRLTSWLLAGAALSALGCPASQDRAPTAESRAAEAVANRPQTPEARPAESKPQRHPVTEAEVPKTVLDAWAKAYPGAKVTGWEQRGDVYIARGQDATRWLRVWIAADGTLKEAQEELAPDAAPAPVKSAFAASPYAKLTYVDGFKRVMPGKDDANAVLYKFVVKSPDKNLVAVYDKDGKLVKEKTMAGDEFDKWHREHAVTK
jgi:hypothetical protein